MLKKWLKSRVHDFTTAVDFVMVTALMVFAAVWAYRQYIDTPPFVDLDKYPIRGIDVSVHNGMMNLNAAAQDGVNFIFIKATEGATHRDANFSLNYKKAQEAGLMTGAYHFFRFDVDGTAQAINLLNAVKDKELQLGIAIDVEEHGNPENVPPEKINERLLDMADYLTMRGFHITIYTNRKGYNKFIRPIFNEDDISLWLCSFKKITPDYPVTFWQYNHHGKVSGINGDVDINIFYGNRHQWHEYLKAINKPSGR